MWLNFIILSVITVIAGYNLSKYGDRISENTSISSGFIGFFLLALATSLPELTTSLSATLIEKSPEMALGNIFGSNLFNLMIIVIMEFLSKKDIFPFIKTGTLKSAVFIYLISLTAIIPIAYSQLFNIRFFSKLNFNIESIIIFLIYILALFKSAGNDSDEEKENNDNKDKKRRNDAFLKFSIAAIVIIISGIYLTKTVDNIAEHYDLGKTFAGSLFLAAVTSLPEASVSLAAIKFDAIEMAVGNLLGSNVFNVLIVFFIDIFSKKQILYLPKLKISLIPGLFSLLLLSVFSYGIINDSKRKKIFFYKFSYVSVTATLAYFLATYLTYKLK
jgi:cation:H+ antiporter